ncbi:hypothetical protein BDQ17DRAFT_217829 [Cyathus striatus]|nr:hypothetical protein BDQ17DRAFT_217829 [Cyathus striatus]
MSTTASDSSSSSINSQMRRRSGRSPVTLNVSMANQPGPRRIPLEPLEYRGNFKRPRGDQDPSSEEREESGEDSARAQKRYRAENDSFGPQGHETQYRRTSSQYSENVPQSHRQAQYADTSSPSDGYSAHQEHGRGVPQHDFNPHGYMSQDDYPPPPPPPALDRILGRSVDAYISDHMEQYDRSVKRWKDCSMEEWIKGAEEITAKYTKILDFVRASIVLTYLAYVTPSCYYRSRAI